MAIYPVVLSGGSGTRLWPLSRAMRPKQFIQIFGSEEPSFLAATSRLSGQRDFAAPIIVCNDDHRFHVRAECKAAEVTPRLIVLEPTARNTAPAIAAAGYLVSDDPDAIMCVMPSDHIIEGSAAFLNGVIEAAQLAAEGRLVLFGIEPTEPHTGYGYIQRAESLRGNTNAYDVGRFAEKPDAETAAEYVKSGRYLWNSGIFILHAGTFLNELARFEPEVSDAVAAAVEAATTDLEFLRLDPASFARSPSISVDYAVMERTEKAAVIPLSARWSDVGSWDSLWQIGERDDSENVTRGDVLLTDTEGSFVHSERSLVATLGVKDLVIVDTPDALLVADRHRAQEVGSIVAALKRLNRTEHEQHLRDYRPWGFFETLSLGSRFRVKLLHVAPGAQLSMQMHHHRSEHWIVVKGTARVTINENVSLVRESESLYIQATEWHRVENPGKIPLELIEVQIGSYLLEDDIVRADDVYNRVTRAPS